MREIKILIVIFERSTILLRDRITRIQTIFLPTVGQKSVMIDTQEPEKSRKTVMNSVQSSFLREFTVEKTDKEEERERERERERARERKKKESLQKYRN